MDRNPARTAVRSTRRKERLGNGEHVCLFCGYSEPTALIPVTKKFLQDHHVVSRKRDSELISVLCRNCHALASEDLLQEDIDMQPETNPNALVASMLDALAVFLEALVAAVRRWAQIFRQAISEGRNG
jgi:hypothetical protein